MMTYTMIGGSFSFALTIWLFFGSSWSVFNSWYAYCYLSIFAASLAIGWLSRGKLFLVSFSVMAACGKFLGVIVLAWLRWGYQAQWMSGWLGMFLIVLALLFYVVGLPFALLICCKTCHDIEDSTGDS